jgi:hypothetical protein
MISYAYVPDVPQEMVQRTPAAPWGGRCPARSGIRPAGRRLGLRVLPVAWRVSGTCGAHCAGLRGGLQPQNASSGAHERRVRHAAVGGHETGVISRCRAGCR